MIEPCKKWLSTLITLSVLTGISFLPLDYMPATARTYSDFFQYRMHEHFCIFNDLISSDQFRDHPFDFVHKLCITECALLHIQKFLLPFRCHEWGLDLLRHYRDQCNSFMCRKKVLSASLSVSFPASLNFLILIACESDSVHWVASIASIISCCSFFFR